MSRTIRSPFDAHQSMQSAAQARAQTRQEFHAVLARRGDKRAAVRNRKPARPESRGFAGVAMLGFMVCTVASVLFAFL